jgi:hypothetical protein
MDDDHPSAVLATTGKISTMADGSFRLVCEIEPRHAQEAFRLFGAPGTTVAIARVDPAVALREDRKQQEQAVKGGVLAKLAGTFCGDEDFRRWLRLTYDPLPRTADDAAEIIRRVCRVDSRAYLDHLPEAAAIFHEKFRLPYNAWLNDGMK